MTPADEFTIYSVSDGFCCVCTTLTDEETAERVNQADPAGTNAPWAISTGSFANGKPSGKACDHGFTNHRHVLLEPERETQ